MTVPDLSGRNASSCGSSGIYKPATFGCKVTNIIAGWISAMVS